MRICFVVNGVRTQRPTYTTAHLAFSAFRRGHDVGFVSVDALSQGQGEDGEVQGEMVRPRPGRLRDTAGYVKALTSPQAVRETARLNDFDVVFLRNNPNAGKRRRSTAIASVSIRRSILAGGCAGRASWWSTIPTD